MFWRALREEDLTACLDIDARHGGYELVGNDRAIEGWRTMMRSCAFQSAVIESDLAIGGHRIVGFGAAAFVSRAFADRELSNPRPGLNARVIASVASGESVVLDETQLRQANTQGDLDLVVLYGQWRNDVLNAEQVLEAQTVLIAAFLEKHRGFRLHRILMEVVSEAEKSFYLDPGGIFRMVSEFPEFYAQHPSTEWNRDRCLAVVTRQEAFQVTGHITGMLFQHREPALGLSDADRRLLEAALSGLTDEELAGRLQIRLPSVKKRWRSIIERVSARADLFPGIWNGVDEGSRGRQKRHYVLAYVREHPEELRPFVTKDRGSSA